MIKLFKIDLRSIVKFTLIGIIWGVIPVTAQSRGYPSWQEYLKDGNPYLLFLAGFSGYFLMSLYTYRESKKMKDDEQ